jgi:hypothetical protein
MILINIFLISNLLVIGYCLVPIFFEYKKIKKNNNKKIFNMSSLNSHGVSSLKGYSLVNKNILKFEEMLKKEIEIKFYELDCFQFYEAGISRVNNEKEIDNELKKFIDALGERLLTTKDEKLRQEAFKNDLNSKNIDKLKKIKNTQLMNNELMNIVIE